MAIKLIILSTDDNSTQELLCEQSLITFGRSKSCAVPLDNSRVSRRHFIIRYTENQYILIDENSTAGTILDGVQLDPKNCYQLGSHHEINVPGFVINLINDGKAPRQERTTVMARKLMGKILNDANDADNLPRLIHASKNLVFYFHDDKISFVVGTLTHLDFVLDNEGEVAKEHATFIRDISGIRIMPIMGASTVINERLITDPEIINHNDKIKLGTIELIFQEYQDDEAIHKLCHKSLTNNIINEDDVRSETDSTELSKKSSMLLDYFDRIVWVLLLVSAAGVSWVAYKLIFSDAY